MHHHERQSLHDEACMMGVPGEESAFNAPPAYFCGFTTTPLDHTTRHSTNRTSWRCLLRHVSSLVEMDDESSPALDGVVVRNPTWGCRCGTDSNFCSRAQCRGRGAAAPIRFRKVSRDEINKRKKQNDGKSAQGGALAKAQRKIEELQRQLQARGNVENGGNGGQKPKFTGGPKACPNGCVLQCRRLLLTHPLFHLHLMSLLQPPDLGVLRQCAEALRAMPSPAQQQLVESLTAMTDEQRAAKQKEMPLARRVQKLDTQIEKKKRALETLEANHKEVSEAFLHFQTLLQDTSKWLHDAKTEF